MPCYFRHSPRKFRTKLDLHANRVKVEANSLQSFSSPSAGLQFTAASVSQAVAGVPVGAGSRWITARVLFSSNCFATTIG